MWERLNSHTLVDCFHVKVNKDEVRLPNGAIIPDFYTVRIPDAAMICAITDDDCVLLKREYRYACGEEVIECPAGMFDEAETDPLVVAKRELLEETGYSSTEWTYFGPTWESTSKLTNKIHLFMAKGCKKVASQHLDTNEHIMVMKVKLIEAVDMIMSRKINANSTAHLILRVARLMEAL